MKVHFQMVNNNFKPKIVFTSIKVAWKLFQKQFFFVMVLVNRIEKKNEAHKIMDSIIIERNLCTVFGSSKKCTQRDGGLPLWVKIRIHQSSLPPFQWGKKEQFYFFSSVVNRYQNLFVLSVKSSCLFMTSVNQTTKLSS